MDQKRLKNTGLSILLEFKGVGQDCFGLRTRRIPQAGTWSSMKEDSRARRDMRIRNGEEGCLPYSRADYLSFLIEGM